MNKLNLPPADQDPRNPSYKFKNLPINLNTYGKFYGLPSEEIFTGWFSFGFGLGLELDKFLLKSKSNDDN